MNVDALLVHLSRNARHPCDLAALALHLARDEYPQLDVEAYLSELDAMGHEARNYVRGDFDAQVQGLCRYLFHEMGFRGNQQNYYDPNNSYLNQVLDRRRGIPITLSLVAMAVGSRVGLPVAGVGLPGHLIAKAAAGGREVLFDPFHGGRILSPEQCELLVQRVTSMPFRATAQSLEALPAGLFVRRLLTNLKAIYLRAGDYPRAVRVLERLRQLAPDDRQEQRDLGVALLHAGRPGRAIDHLTCYLDAVPDAADADAVRQQLERARGEVAKWN